MAIEQYDRRLVPSGIPQLPPTRPSPLGAAFEAAAAGFDNAAAGVGRAEALKRQKDEEDAAAWAANALAKTKLQWTKTYLEREQAAPAGAPGFAGAIESDFAKYSEEQLAAAPSPRARQYLADRLLDFQGGLVSDALRFEAGARLDKRVADTKETINLNRNVVATDPRQFANVLGDTVGAIAALDLPPAKKQALIVEARQGLAFSAVQARIPGDPATVLDELKTGKWDALLDADNKAGLANQAEGEIRRIEAEARQRRAEAEAAYTADLADYAAGLASGYLPYDPKFAPARIRAIVGGERGERLARGVETAQATGLLHAEVATATPAELAAIQAQLEANLRDPQAAGFRDRAQMADTFATLVAARDRDLTADPAGYAAKSFEGVRQAAGALFQALGDPQAAPEARRKAAQAYIVAQEQAQGALGVEPAQQRLLTGEMAAQVAAQFGGPNAKGDQALATAQAYADAFGPAWPRLAREIGKDLPAHVNTVLAMDAPEQANDRAFVAAANEKAAEIKTALKGQVKDSEVAAEVDRALGPARASIAAPGAGGEATYAQLQAATLATTYALIAQGQDPADAADRAAAMTFGKKYATGEGDAAALRFPKSFDPAAIEAGAAAALDEVAGLNLDPPESLGGLGLADARAQYANAVRARGRWITAPDESGAQLVDEFGWPVTIFGQPVVKSWAALESAGRAAPRGGGRIGLPQVGSETGGAP